MSGGEVVITQAVAYAADGSVAARIDAVGIGGGTRLVEGEEVQHELRQVFHVRCVSPDPSVPDQLVEVGDYDAAVQVAVEYADKLDAHAEAIAGLAEGLRVDAPDAKALEA